MKQATRSSPNQSGGIWRQPWFIFIVMAIAYQDGHAQAIHGIIFEGAGIRGIAYAGSIKILEQQKALDSLERVGGTSAGAIAALCISLGYKSDEIEKLIYETPIQKFNDGKFMFIGGIARTNRRFGWYRGKAMMDWLEEIIARKTNSEITFAELHEKGFIDLYVTGTSINRQRLIVFSRAAYPKMKIKDAVRISMSIPLYFEAVFIDQDGKPYTKENAPSNADIMVDGGLTGNFPIQIFDTLSLKGARVFNRGTIGLRMDTPGQIAYDTASGGLAPMTVDRFGDYLGAFYNYILENLNRASLTEGDWERTVSISSGTIGPRIKKLSTEEKTMLMNNGSLAMSEFLRKKH